MPVIPPTRKVEIRRVLCNPSYAGDMGKKIKS
jgi:hypothetical protein